MDDLEQRISASFRAQSLMTILGAELVHIAEGEVHVALSPRPELCQQHGQIHAGVLTTVLDSACGYAAMTVAQPGLEVLTVEFKVSFIRPALADRFLAVGKVTTAGNSLTACQGELIVEEGSQRKTIAVMQATINYVAANSEKGGT